MKTSWFVGVVVIAHVVIIGGALLMQQGCGTSRRTGGAAVSRPTAPVMPPAVVAPTKPVVRPPPTRVAAPPKKAWPAETTQYVVGKNESLSTIAKRFGLSVAELATINSIRDPNRIRSGQRLVLPGRHRVDVEATPADGATAASSSAPTVRPAAAPAVVAASEEGTYVVQPGDSLSRLATRFHTTQAAIREANKLKSAQIRVGQRLAIPDLAEQSASKPAAAAVQPSEPAAATKVEAAPAKTAVTAPPKGEAKAEPKAAAAKTPATPPGKSASAAAASAPTTPQTASSVAGKGIRIHVVDPDEDLYSVAMMWGVSVAELKELNGLTNTTLKPGDRLKIPMTEQ